MAVRCHSSPFQARLAFSSGYRLPQDSEICASIHVKIRLLAHYSFCRRSLAAWRTAFLARTCIDLSSASNGRIADSSACNLLHQYVNHLPDDAHMAADVAPVGSKQAKGGCSHERSSLHELMVHRAYGTGIKPATCRCEARCRSFSAA